MLTRPHTRRIAPWLGAIALLASVAIAAPPMVPTVDTAFSDASYDALGIPNHAVVDAAIERLTVDERGKTFIEAALDRRPEHQTFVRDALTRAGLPVELEAVALIESGYDDQLTTGDIHSAAPAGGPIGAGLWMFIPATAREYGLRVDAQVDERLDLERETDAAIALLSDLYLEFGDWGLALAAYNQGPRHVHDAIQTHGTRDVPTLVQAGGLNRYVPTVWAGMLILSDD